MGFRSVFIDLCNDNEGDHKLHQRGNYHHNEQVILHSRGSLR